MRSPLLAMGRPAASTMMSPASMPVASATPPGTTSITRAPAPLTRSILTPRRGPGGGASPAGGTVTASARPGTKAAQSSEGATGSSTAASGTPRSASWWGTPQRRSTCPRPRMPTTSRAPSAARAPAMASAMARSQVSWASTNRRNAGSAKVSAMSLRSASWVPGTVSPEGRRKRSCRTPGRADGCRRPAAALAWRRLRGPRAARRRSPPGRPARPDPAPRSAPAWARGAGGRTRTAAGRVPRRTPRPPPTPRRRGRHRRRVRPPPSGRGPAGPGGETPRSRPPCPAAVHAAPPACAVASDGARRRRDARPAAPPAASRHARDQPVVGDHRAVRRIDPRPRRRARPGATITTGRIPRAGQQEPAGKGGGERKGTDPVSAGRFHERAAS